MNMVNDTKIDKHFEKYVKRNRVFILGAGFSAGASVPLTTLLLDKAMIKFSSECPGIFSRVDAYAHESIEQDDKKPIDYSKISFADLCTFLEYIELREFGGLERWSSAGSREKLALRFYLAKTIVEHTPLINNLPEMYIQFAQQLHEKDVVISFNWDGLLEIALQRVGKLYTYDWGIKSAVRLCKLHGSVNWRLNEPNSLGRPRNTLDWKSLDFIQGMSDVEVYATQALLDFETWQHYQPLGEVEPFLVLPGYGKAHDVRSIANLWYKLEFAFSMTHDVYIIGLGLVPDDFFIRSLFLSNLPFIDSYSGVKGRRIYIINPDKKAHQNYNFVLSTDYAELLNEEFSINHVILMKERLKNS